MDVYLHERDVPARDEAYQLADGAQLAAQNVLEAIYTPVGSLPWGREDGSYLDQWRNDLLAPDQVVAELERVALTMPDDMVVPASVQGSYNPDSDVYTLAFQGPGFVPVQLLATPAATLLPGEPEDTRPAGRYLLIGAQHYLLLNAAEYLVV